MKNNDNEFGEILKPKIKTVGSKYFDEFGIKHAQEAFRSNNVIEAFAYLHTLIELNLFTGWMHFVLSTQGIKAIKPWRYKRNWSYSELIRLFDQLGELMKNDKKVLSEFNESRNDIIHTFAHPLLSKIPHEEKELELLFKKGLEAYEISSKIQNKFMTEVKNKKIWEKWEDEKSKP